MKKTIINIIMFVQALFSSQVVCAQQNTIAMQRKVVDEAISTIEDYETYATISDDEIRYSFVELFVSAESPVYNDLLGLSAQSTLTAREYSQLLGEGPRNKNAVISNLKKERVWNDDGTWKALFSFEKTLAYSDNCGVYFSSQEFYDQVYHLEATLIYDEQLNKCKIEEIKGSVDSHNKLPENYFVFQSEDERDARLSYNGNKLSFNTHGQVFLAGKMDKKDYRVYCVLGDGEIEEGQVWEAAMSASHYKLDNLCVIVDNNNLQIDGTIEEVMSSYPIDEKFKSFGFQIINIEI